MISGMIGVIRERDAGVHQGHGGGLRDVAEHELGVVRRSTADREQADQVEEARATQVGQRLVVLDRVDGLLDGHARGRAHHRFPAPQEGEEEGDRADQDEPQGGRGEDALDCLAVDQHGCVIGGLRRRVGIGGQLRGRLLDGRDLRGDDVGEQDATDGRAERASGNKLGPFIHRLAHRGGQRAVGNVDQGIDQAQGRISQVGVKQLCVHVGVDLEDSEPLYSRCGDIEVEEAEEQDRDGEPQDERPELAPACHDLVDRAAGEQVGEGVPQAYD